MTIIRNDRPGNWAFGISKSRDFSAFYIHFAVWHITFNLKGS